MEAVVSIQWVHSGVLALLNGQVKDVKQVSEIMILLSSTVIIKNFTAKNSFIIKRTKVINI